jgi:hypothetical protein
MKPIFLEAFIEQVLLVESTKWVVYFEPFRSNEEVVQYEGILP